MLYFTTRQILGLGKVFLISRNGTLINLAIEGQKHFPSKVVDKATRYDYLEIFNTATGQLSEYMSGTRKEFSKFYSLEGTAFQKRVWSRLQRIQYGQTSSYKKVACSLDNPKAIRAVASAIARNPLMLIIPCHRVIGENGSLTGYAAGLNLKTMLLENEVALY